MKKLSSRDLKNLELQSAAKNTGAPAIGLDLGEKFCGLAWSPDGTVVLPLEVVKRENLELALDRTRKKIGEKNPVLVIGLPVSGDGSENEWCREVRKIAEKLSKKFEVKLMNERCSSAEVFSTDEKKSARGGRIDDLAAAKILEYWLQKKL